MRRREFLLALGAVAISPSSPVRAQTRAKPARLGVLVWGSPGRDVYVEPFRQGLRELGYAEGRDVRLDIRYAEGDSERALAAVRDFVRQEVEVIVASTTPAAHAAKSATATVPIVMAPVADALATGLVANLARPAGNLTGVSGAIPELTAKQLEILIEIVPRLGLVGFLGSTRDPNAQTFLREAEAAAASRGIEVRPHLVGGPEEFAAALTAMRSAGCGAVIVQPIFASEAAVIAELAGGQNLPTASTVASARAGLLIGYGSAIAKVMRQAAGQVDKILKGAKPADLPVEQPTHFELVLNLRTAQALGLTIPPTLLARADEVIE